MSVLWGLATLVLGVDLEGDVPSGVRAFFRAHCYECHAGADPEAGLSLERWLPPVARDASASVDVEIADEVADRLRFGDMPPEERTRPSAAEVDEILAWLNALERPRTALRRLNRREYTNTVRELTGVHFDAADFLPEDEIGDGYDNSGESLALPPMLFDRYVEAAERIAHEALLPGGQPRVERWEGARLRSEGGARLDSGSWNLYSRATLRLQFDCPEPAEYRLRVRAGADQAGPDPARMGIALDGEPFARVAVRPEEPARAVYEARLWLDAGWRTLEVAFLNDYFQREDTGEGAGDRNLHIEWIELEGRFESPSPSLLEERFGIALAPFANEGAQPALPALASALMRSAYRRPVEASEVDRLVAFANSGASGASGEREAMESALVAVLVTPRFLFRDERPGEGGLDAYQAAQRLSYFLWSSMPDAELDRAASTGELETAAGFERQVRRMLRSPRASALARSFAPQWLQTRKLARHEPNGRLFPHFDAALRAAMEEETQLFFEAIVREDRSLRELLRADFTFVNGPLAAHYGWPGVEGVHMRRVPVEGGRGGVLTHASVLTATSTPTRTSPVLRGKFVLEALLGAPPPPPPPGVDDLPEHDDEVAALTIRERLERHRVDPACSVCHETMDALGFALENYDAVGRWRDRDRGVPVDPRGSLLADGAKIEVQGARELAEFVLADRRFVEHFTSELAVYALGRGLRGPEREAVRALAGGVGGDSTIADVILAFCASDVFWERSRWND